MTVFNLAKFANNVLCRRRSLRYDSHGGKSLSTNQNTVKRKDLAELDSFKICKSIMFEYSNNILKTRSTSPLSLDRSKEIDYIPDFDKKNIVALLTSQITAIHSGNESAFEHKIVKSQIPIPKRANSGNAGNNRRSDLPRNPPLPPNMYCAHPACCPRAVCPSSPCYASNNEPHHPPIPFVPIPCPPSPDPNPPSPSPPCPCIPCPPSPTPPIPDLPYPVIPCTSTNTPCSIPPCTYPQCACCQLQPKIPTCQWKEEPKNKPVL